MKKTSLLIFIGLISASVAIAAPAKKIKTAKASAVSKSAEENTISTDASVYSKKQSALAGTKIRPVFGMNFMNPKKLNSYMMSNSAVDSNSGIKLGTGMSYGIAAEYPMTKNFFAGLRLEYLSTSSDSITLKNDVAQAQSFLSGWPLMLTASYVQPLDNSWNMGVGAAAGFVLGYNTSFEFTNSKNKDAVPEGTLSYGATPFTAMGSTFVSYDITKKFATRFDAGYRILSNSQMKATDAFGKGDNKVKEGDLLKDESNKNISVNASSFNLGISFVYTI